MTRYRLLTLLLAAALLHMTLAAAPRDKNNILSVKQSITDDNIVFPESFDTDTHEMMKNWYLQNYAVLDADVENRSAGEVSDEVYIKRLAAIPSVIEMPYNQVVRKYIDRYITRNRTLVEEMLGMSLYYMPIFEQALEKEGLPMELKYLPVVESALDPNAVSRAGAAGLWQFMVGTGKGLGLEVNSLVDERRDPYRSSEMAARYLKNLYQIYHDWSLAIAAYNCGPGNVNKALHRNGDEGDFWDIYNYLPRETRGYVPAFIAANYVMTYFKQHNISPSLARKPLITDTVSVNRRVHFSQIAQVLNMPIEEIRAFNPQFRHDVIPGDNHPYMLVLPSQQVYSFIMSEDSIANYRNDLYAQREVVEPGGYVSTTEEYVSGKRPPVYQYHKVARGETAAGIAAKYGMTTDELLTLNGMSSSRVVRGQNLKVNAPRPTYDDDDEIKIVHSTSTPDNNDDVVMNYNSDEPSGEQEQAQIDEVRNIEREASKSPYKGSYRVDTDTPAKSSSKTSTAKKAEPAKAQQQPAVAKSDSKQWRSRNAQYSEDSKKSTASKETTYKNSKSSKSSAKSSSSKSSKKSAAKEKEKKPAQPTEVTVQKGESLTKIAEKAGVSVDDLKKANNIDDGNKIKAGEKIKIPGKDEKEATSKKGSKASKSSKSSKADKATSKSSKSSSKSSKASKSSKSSSKSSKSTSTSKKSSKKKKR